MRLISTALWATALLLIGAISPVYGATDDAVTSRADVCYGTANGEKLLLDVYLPPASSQTTASASGLRPAVALIHGGGWSGGNKRDYNADGTWFAKHGLVCFAVEYRLVKPNDHKWPAQLDDVQLAVRWIRQHAAEYGANPAAVGAIGGSAGGHLVSLLGMLDTRDTATAELASQSSRVNCVVDLFGPSDFTADFVTSGPYGLNVQKMVDDLLGVPAHSAPDKARAASPLFCVNKDVVPFLILHGDNDALVPLDQSIRLNDALKKAGVDSTLIVMKDEGHGFKPADLELMRQQSLKFFNKHLGQK